MKRLVTCALIIFLAAGGLAACSQEGGKITTAGVAIKDAWARPGKTGDNTAVYFKIENAGREDDQLLSAACDFAEACELHLSEMDSSGNMKMTHKEKVPVPGKQSVFFKPGGLHIMVMKLQKELKVGDTFAVTLNFEKAGALKVEAPVQEQQE